MKTRILVFGFFLGFGLLSEARHSAEFDVRNKVKDPTKASITAAKVSGKSSNDVSHTTAPSVSLFTNSSTLDSDPVAKLKLQLQELKVMKQKLETETISGALSKRKEQVLSHIEKQILLREKQLLELALSHDQQSNLVKEVNWKPVDNNKISKLSSETSTARHQQKQQQQAQELLLPDNQIPTNNRALANNTGQLADALQTLNQRGGAIQMIPDLKPSDSFLPDLGLSESSLPVQTSYQIHESVMPNKHFISQHDMAQYQPISSIKSAVEAVNSGPQHVLVPLDSLIQRQMYHPERYIIINQAVPENSLSEKTQVRPNDAHVTVGSTTPLPKVKPITAAPRPRKTTSSDEEPPTTLIPPITLSPAAGSPADVESMKKNLLKVELKKQQLEIRKLELEIRALQREEMGMFRNMGGESEDQPQRNPFRFGGRPMPFPFPMK